MAGKPWYVAFAGSGDTSATNVKELLNDWLPQQIEDMAIAPVPRRGHKGLKNTQAWLNEECGDDACEEVEVADLADWLLGFQDKGEVHLVFIPAEEWDEESAEAKLVRKCIAEKIPVHNLAEGLDDFVPPEPSAPEGENKPAEEQQEKPARRRGKPRGERFDPEKEPARIEAAKAAVAASQEAAQDDPPWDTQEAPPAPQAPAAAGVPVILSPATIEALMGALALVAADVKASVIAELPDSAKPKVQTYPFWVDEDGNYRPRVGRGRGKGGETKVELTIAEMDQLQLEFPA